MYAHYHYEVGQEWCLTSGGCGYSEDLHSIVKIEHVTKGGRAKIGNYYYFPDGLRRGMLANTRQFYLEPITPGILRKVENERRRTSVLIRIECGPKLTDDQITDLWNLIRKWDGLDVEQ